jgi:hypothetical protein
MRSLGQVAPAMRAGIDMPRAWAVNVEASTMAPLSESIVLGRQGYVAPSKDS